MIDNDLLIDFINTIPRGYIRTETSLDHYFSEKITSEMIIKARKIAGLTQKQSAELLYVDERTWQRWESGDRNMARGLFKLYLIETEQI